MATTEEAEQNRLKLDIEHADGVAVVRCSGKLVAGVNDVLYREVSKLIPQSKKIVLDLTDLAYMDSMGLGTIVRLYVSTKSAGCELQMVNMGKRVRELLGMTHLLNVFTVCGEHTLRMP